MSTGKKRIFAYLVMILSLVAAVNLIKDIWRLKSVDKRVVEAQQELEAAKQEQEELRQKLAQVKNGSFTEKQVRNVLKMAKPEEVIVVVPEEVRRPERFNIENQEKEAPVESNLIQWWQVFNQ